MHAAWSCSVDECVSPLNPVSPICHWMRSDSVISRKRALELVAFLRKETSNLRHPMGLRHPVSTVCTSWLLLHIYTCHVTRTNESFHTFKRVMCHTWTARFSDMLLSFCTSWGMSHIWRSHVTRAYESFHTCWRVICHVRTVEFSDIPLYFCTSWCVSHVRRSHVTRTNLYVTCTIE